MTAQGPSADDLAVLAQVVTRVTRGARLSPDDALDFEQAVHVRLIERDYAAFQKFEGRSSLRTYLTVVVTRMLADQYRASQGKWRPSAAARQGGPTSVAIERLIHRDGMTTDQAIEALRCARHAPPVAELRRLADRLSARPQRRFVSDSCLAKMGTFTDPLEELERRQASRRIRSALGTALRRLSREDRELIDLRYGRRHRVAVLAGILRSDAKTLYRRYDRALRVLRASLEADGVTSSAGLSER